MKKGDIVTVRDSSYSKVVTSHGLKDSYDGLHSVRGEQGVIIEIGCEFPDPYKYQKRDGVFNNTIVRTNSGKVVFIEERFLQLILPKHKVMIDLILHPGYGMGGIVVEISDKLYKEITREP